MKALLIVLPLILTYQGFAQKLKNPCERFKQILSDAQKSEANSNFTDAMRKLYAAQVEARNCGEGKEEKVKDKIVKLFIKIENLREQADVAAREAKKQEDIAKRQTIQAQKSTREAMMATNEATALYWASEADKMVPSQGLRLLEVATKITNSSRAVKFIKEQTEKIFKGSISHQFKEMFRYKGQLLASSADGLWLLTRTKEEELQVWNTFKKHRYDFLKNQKGIYDGSFSANGAWLITHSDRGESRVWETESGEVPELLKNQKIIQASFSANGALLYIQNNRGESLIWETGSGLMLDFLKEQKIDRVRFSADGTWLITFTSERESQVWDVCNKQMHNFLKGHKINFGRFSANGAWLYTQSDGGESRVWETATGLCRNFQKDLRGIREASFSADGTMLITHTKLQDWETQIWEIETEIVPDFLQGKGDFKYANFSTDGTLLIADNGKEFGVWETTIKQVPNFLKDQKIYHARFSEDGAWLITFSEEVEPLVWDTRNERMYNFLKEPRGINDGRFSYYGTRLNTNDAKLNSYVWDTDNWWVPQLLKDKKNIKFTSFSADGTWVITHNAEEEFRMWETSSGEFHDFILKDRNGMLRADFMADKILLISYRNESQDRKWKIKSDTMFDFLKDQKNVSVSFSTDGNLIVTGTRSGIVLPFQEMGRELSDNYLQGQNVDKHISVSADGRLRAIVSEKIITTIDVGSGDTLQTLYINTEPNRICFGQNRYLYVVAGRAIIKTDIMKQPGNLFSYGDCETLDYTYDEIKEWMKEFSEKYLPPLDEQTKKKYGVKE